jgi:hypothetical protein
LIFLAGKTILYFIFKSNPGDPFEICIYGNQRILSNLFTNHIYAKNIFLNFGGLYIFIILLFATGRVKRFYSVSGRKKVYIYLTIIPFLILGIFVIYFSEVRVYSELMPMVSTLFLIYIGTGRKLQFKFIKNEQNAGQQEKY